LSSSILDTSALSTEWLALAAIAGTTLVMFFLARRLMRGMNQQDWILLRQARQRGIDITQPQSVGFVLFTNNWPVANELVEKLRQDGYETGIKEAQIQYARDKKKSDKSHDGVLITATKMVLLTPEVLKQQRQALNDLADAPRAVYLGWQVSGTSPVAAAPPPAP